jgi:hypothetical protein
MFLLVPQAKLRQRFDLIRVANRQSVQLSALIEQRLRSK